ncbi:hypothetical protein ACC718_39230, partial [Rhizobium ruizarguesonis]
VVILTHDAAKQDAAWKFAKFAAGRQMSVRRIDQRDLGGAQIELVDDILDRVAQRACCLELETDLAGCESLFAGGLGEN